MSSEANILNPQTTVLETLRLADKANDLVFLISNNGRLTGYLTDIKLRNIASIPENLNRQIQHFASKNFAIVDNGAISASEASIIIEQKDSKLKKIYGPELEINTDISNVPVIIMAGGFGTRLKPFTNIIPKPLFPIGDKAILEIIIEKFRRYNISDFYLTLNFKAAFIKAYFAEIEREYNVYYVHESKPLGTAGSLRFLEDKFDIPFFVSNCDILINTDYRKIYLYHVKNNFDLTIVGAIERYQIPYGICEIDRNDFSLVKIHEKPTNYFIINTGMYVLNPQVLKIIPKNKFYHITDLINDIKRQGGKVGVFPISEDSWIDIGTLDEFKKNLHKIIEPTDDCN